MHEQHGDFAEAQKHKRKAVSLAPDSKVLQATANDEVLVIEAEDAVAVLGRMSGPVASRSSAFAKPSDLETIKAAFVRPPAKGKSIEVLAATFRDGETFVVKLFVNNTSSTAIVLDKSDTKSGRAVACFTNSGKRVGPEESKFNALDWEQCRANQTIRIEPGSLGRPHAIFTGDPSTIARCVFYNLPREGSVVQVNLGATKK